MYDYARRFCLRAFFMEVTMKRIAKFEKVSQEEFLKSCDSLEIYNDIKEIYVSLLEKLSSKLNRGE